MRRALRRVWSPGWVLFVYAGTYVLFDVFFAMLLFTETRGGFAQLDRDVLGIAISNVTVAALVTILAGLYGAYRVWGFHPIFQAEYHRWLRSTPWSAPRKLPMGPVHVVWQDLLLLTILTLLMLRHISLVVGTKAGVEWAVPTTLILMLPGLAFLVSRLILLAITFRFTRVPDFAFAIGFGFGFLLLARGMLIPTLLVAIGLYVIEFMGLRRALHQFCDWDLRLLPSQGINRQTALREAQKNQPSASSASIIGVE